jgi:TolB-like protein
MTPERHRQIGHIFDQVLEVAPEQRTEFLDHACAGDPSLRSEVESLLSSHEKIGDFITAPAMEVAAKALANVTPTSIRLTEGMTLEFYEILALIGVGGMGEVYLARDTQLDRKIALKVLRKELTTEADRLRRFQQEARAVSALNHPNIVTIHEIGRTGRFDYIAYEFVEGETLRRRMERPLKLAEALDAAAQIAAALVAAHAAGVIHRDLKPENIMVRPDGYVKVLDFGLAKLTEATPAADFRTQPGLIMGTFAYMSPEQARGLAVDARSDIFSFGVVLYEMAAGRRPFEGPTTSDVVAAVLTKEPEPLDRYLEEAPAELQRIVTRALAKNLEARYSNVKDLWLDLKGLKQSVDMAAAFSLSLPAISQRVSGGSAAQIQSLAVLPLENLSGDPEQEYFAAGMHETLITDLARIGVRKVIAKPSADAFKGTRKTLRDIGRELGVDALVTGSVIRANNRLRITAQLVRAESGEVLWANRYERPTGDVLSLQNELVIAIAREVQAKITAEQSAQLAIPRPINPDAHDAYLKGRFLYSSFTSLADRKLLDEAIAQLEQAIHIDPAYAPPYAALSVAHQASTQISFSPPKDSFPKARAAALKAVELDDSLAEAHAALAQVFLWYDWNWAAAERESQRALELNAASVHTLTASVEQLLLVKNRFDEAAATSQRILDLDPLNPFARLQTIWVSFFSRRYDDSIRQGKTFVELWPPAWIGHFFLAMNYAAKQMSRDASAECTKVMEATSGGYVMQALGTCVWALGVVGQTAEANRLLLALEKPPPGVWLDPSIMAVAYGGLGDIDRAVAWAEKGIQARAPNMIYMKVGATWDAMRSDPRFQALLRRMNFPE